jgi:hypothetical protein
MKRIEFNSPDKIDPTQLKRAVVIGAGYIRRMEYVVAR